MARMTKCTNEAFKKGMTSVDAIDVGRGTREGLSSPNLPHQPLRRIQPLMTPPRRWMALAAPPSSAQSKKSGRVFTQRLFDRRWRGSHPVLRCRPHAPTPIEHRNSVQAA